MRRWGLPLLVALAMVPLVAMATGTLTTPNVIGSQPRGNVNASLLDANWTQHASYINAREITQDLAANRPAAGVKGRWYFATDTNGGTLYNDTGSAWVQVAAPVTNSLAEQLTGLIVSNNATNPSSTIAVSVGAATSDDATITSRVLMILSSAYTKTTATWAVGTGNGCLDSGTVAASTWYSVFLIERLDTSVVDILCSTSATAPTMPTNYTKKRRIMSFLTDASIAINFFTQRLDTVIWATPTALNVNEAGEDANAHTATLTTPNGVVTQALVQACVSASTAANMLYLSDLASADTTPGANANPAAAPLGTIGLFTAGGVSCAPASVYTNTSQQFRFRQQAAGATNGIFVNTIGWNDPRGRQ